MSHQGKLPTPLELTKGHLGGGKKRVRLKQSALHQDKEDTTLSPIQLNLEMWTPAPKLSTLECQAAPNSLTSIGKLQSLETFTLTQNVSQKLGEGLTSKDVSYLPYWNESCKEMSDWLSLPTRTDWQGSALTCSDGYVSKTGANSWFSMRQHSVQKLKWLKTSLPSSTALVQDSTDCESTSLRCRKIQIYPSPELNRVWKQWSAACRYVYNQAIAYQKANGRTGKLKLRNSVMQSNLPQWVKDTPCHIKQNAIFDAHRAYQASKNCKFRSCRAPSQTIKFNNCNYSNGTWYPTLTKQLSFIAREPVPSKCEQGTQLIRCKGRWFAVFPELAILTVNQSDKVIALDPGVRAFLTGFDGSKFLEFGHGDMGRITRLCQHLDKLISRKAKSISRRQRQKMSIAASRMRTKIQDLVNEVHKQTACYLSQNYRIIFLPTFETSQMVQKTKRKIQSKTARAMLSWAHYRFKLFLKQKAALGGCIVVDVTEEYTSKTCTHCGHVHQKLGGSKTFSCPECGHTLPRDMNGALGIMLKALRDTASVTYQGDSAIVALSGNNRINVA